MREYTILSIVSVLCAILLDRVAGTKLLKRGEFYLFLLIIFGFKLLVNGFLTGKEVVIYNPSFFLGLRVGSIPLEDFGFGFSMVMMTIVLWEHFKKDGKTHKVS